MMMRSCWFQKILKTIIILWVFEFPVACPLSVVSVIWAAVPLTINYQGRLTDSQGKAVAGSYSFTFRLYDASTAGSKVWEESQSISLTEADNGVFNVNLGATTSLTSVDFNSPLWLSVQVDTDAEMTPRQKMTSVGYSLNTDSIDGLDSAKFLRTDVDTSTSGKLTITRSGTALLVKPDADPAADTKLIDVQNAAGTSKFSIDLEGDVSVAGNLSITGTLSGSTTTSGTTNATWTIDNDNTSGSEPASGAGLTIEGGSGDASILWDATNDELDVNKNVNVSGTLTATSITVGSSTVGDVTDVGSCSSGACFTSSTPSTSLVFTNATSGSVTLQTVTGALGTKTVSLPATTGTVVTTGDSGTITGTMIADGSSGVSLTSDVTGTLPLAKGGTNNASLTNCSSGQALTVSSGAVACTSTITASSVTTHTLDDAFDDGKTIDGATSSANAMQVGDGSNDILLYTASNVPTIATDGTSDLTIAPDGSDTNITGDVTINTKTINTSTPVGGLFIAEDPTAANSDGVIYLGKNNTNGESPETGGWEYIRWDDDYSIEGKGTGAFYFSDSISVEQQEIRGSSPAGISFGVGSNTKQSFIYDPSGSSFMFSGGQLAQQFRNLVKNGSFEAFSALETFKASTATGGTGGQGSVFQGGWSNFAPDEWLWESGKVFQRAPILFTPGTTITSTNLQKDYYHGKSAVTMEDDNLTVSNTYNDTVTNFGTITDAHMEQTIGSLQPSTIYAVGAYMLTRNSGDTAAGAASTEAIVDITNEDIVTNTTLSTALDAIYNKEMVVGSASSFPDSGVLLIGSERISYSGKDSTKFFQLIRGFEGTTAASHSIGASVTIAPLKHLTTSGSATAGQYTLYTGQFATDALASDVKIHLICKSATSGDQCRFDGLQITEGRTIPEFQPSSIVDTGDQTVYGSLRMGRTSDGRGGILSVDNSVRVRAIEFFEKDPGMSGTTGGFGGVGSAIKVGSGSGSTVTLTTSSSFYGSNPRDMLVTITQVSPAKFKWEYRECSSSTGCTGTYAVGGSNLLVSDYASGGSQYNLPLPGSMGVIITFANTGTVTTSDQWSFCVAGMNMAAQYNSYSGTSTYTPGQTRIYKDPANQKLTFQDGITIVTLEQIAGSGIASAAHVDPPVFFPATSGGGQMYLNTSQGYTNNGNGDVTFDFEIDGNGADPNRDTFKWRDNRLNGPNISLSDWDGTLIQIPAGGGPYGPLTIPGSGGLTYGFTITFGSPVGTFRDGNTGDRWQVRAFAGSSSSVIKTLTGNQGISVTGTGDGRTIGLVSCSPNQVLKRNAGNTDWECAADSVGSSSTLQGAYDATSGNTIALTNARNLALTLADTATDPLFTITTATAGAGYTSITRADGTGSADPAQLLLIDNLDADRAQPIGLKIQSAAGAMTTALDVSDAEIVTAVNIGQNDLIANNGADRTISAAELARLDTKDAALVDANDAVSTAITGVGTLAGLTATGAISLGDNSSTVVLDGSNFDVASTGAMTLTGHVTLSGDANEGLSGGGLSDCDTAGTSKLLWDTTTNKFSCGTDQNTGGTPAWSVLTNPAANLSLTHAEYTTAFTWDTAASSAAFDGTTLAITNDASTDGGNQRLLVLANNDATGTTGVTERFLVLDNKDANEAVTTGIEILASSTGTITTAIDVADDDIGTALAIGTNDVTVGGVTLDSAEFARLDGKNAALVDANDAVSTAITGVGTLAGLTATGAISLGDNSSTVVLDGSNFDVASTGAMTLTGHVTLSGDANEGLSGGGLVDCDTAGTSKLLWDATTNKFSCGTDQNTGSPAWSTLANPAGNLSLAHAEYTTAFTWDTAASSAAFDGTTLAITNDASTDGGNQRLLVLANNDATGTTGVTERFLVLDNKDANEAVTTGIEILASSTGTITTAIDVADDDIGTALAIGTNDVTVGGVTLDSAEFARLDGKNAALVDANDAVSTAITGVGTLAGLTATGAISLGDNSGTVILDGSNFDVASTGAMTLTGHVTLSGDANEGLSGGGLVDCDTAGTSKLLWDTTTNKFSCGTDQNTGGTPAWSVLTNPAANLSLTHAEYTTAFTWDTAASSAAFDGTTLAITNDASTDGGNQRLLVLANNDATGTTGVTERFLVLDNKDANEAVTTGIEILASSTGTITTAIDVADDDIGTALAIGTNDVTVGGVTLDSSEFARLDGKNAALVDANDAVSTAITGVGTLAGLTVSGTSSLGDGGVTNYTTVSNTGVVTYAGSAQPKRTIVLTAGGAIAAPSAGFADQKRTDGTNFSYYTLDFDQSTDEKAFWQFVVPDSLTASSNITVTVFWTAAAGTAGQLVDWEVSTTSLTDDDVWDSALGSATTINDALIATNDLHKTAEGTITSANNAWAAGKLAIVKVVRDADDASNDTLAADAKLVMVKIEWIAAAESD